MTRGLRSHLHRPELRSLVSEQLLVTSAQVVSGVGNFLFVILAGRILSPGGFARLVAFLALYLIVHMPTGSLGAASTVAPERAPGLRRRLIGPVIALALLTAMAAPVGSRFLSLPPLMVVLVGATMAAAPFLSIERGTLHGVSMNRRVALTLIAEPVVRLALGIPLALWWGAEGGAAGVVLAGYAALAVAAFRRPDDARGRWLAASGDRPVEIDRRRQVFWWTAAAFLFLAVFQKQDVLFANRMLPPAEAATFAVVATLGGAAVLASMRVPLVLIPRAAEGSRKALAVALGLAGGLGLGAVAVVALAPELIVTTFFGIRYETAGGIVIPYVAAMGVLALSRVLVAYFCATDRPRVVAAFVGSVVGLHITLLLTMGTDAAGMVYATFLANLVLVLLAIAWAFLRLPGDAHRRAGPDTRLDQAVTAKSSGVGISGDSGT